MSFIASLAAAGTAIASGAAAVGGTLAAGAGAIGSGLAAGAGALGSGIGALGTGLASGASALGSGLGSIGTAIGEGAAAASEGIGGLLGGGGATAPAAGELITTPLAPTTTFIPQGAAFTGGTAANIPNAVIPALAPTSIGGAGGTTLAGAANTVGTTLTAPAAANAAPGFLGSIGEFATAHPIMTSAGVGALGGAVTNPNDPLGGAIKGGAAGAIGGWGASELGGMAGAGGTLGKIGSFAAKHPGITSAGIGMLASPIVGAITPSFSSNKDADLSQMNETDRQNFLRYMRNYTPSLSPGYAAGGITDLDGYMSNAQNIPNPQEVADPEGYGSNSMRLMAGGGLANLIPGGQDVANWLAKNSLPGMIFGWQGASDVPIIGGMFNDPNIANLTPEEKKKLMDNMAAAQGKPVQQMAGGGIADLGSYRSGGSPNLLQGPGDGVSDDLKATIADRQPARLASGEYIVPSRIVSELGNGSTDAGAKRLDMMVQKVNAGRAQTLGGKKYAKDTRAYKHLPV